MSTPTSGWTRVTLTVTREDGGGDTTVRASTPTSDRPACDDVRPILIVVLAYLQGGVARNVGMDALGKISFPSKRERVFASFLLVCTSYIIGSLLRRNPNSLFLEAEKGNPRGIPRNSPGMHNLGAPLLTKNLGR